MRIKILGLGLVLLGVLFITSCPLPPENSIEWAIASVVEDPIDGFPMVEVNGDISNVGSDDLTGVQLEIDILTDQGTIYAWTDPVDIDAGDTDSGPFHLDLSDFDPDGDLVTAILDYDIIGAGWDNPPD